jgi:hypothetical protein
MKFIILGLAIVNLFFSGLFVISFLNNKKNYGENWGYQKKIRKINKQVEIQEFIPYSIKKHKQFLKYLGEIKDTKKIQLIRIVYENGQYICRSEIGE